MPILGVNHITLRHLLIFVQVCDSGNMTAAGERLFMTQPSVSQAISEMEKYYGVKLFERLGKRIYITNPGKKLLSYARHIIKLQQEMERVMQEERDAGGVLRIGASVTVGTCILIKIVQELNKLNPHVTIETVIDNTKVIESMLLVDEVDIGLVEGRIHSRDLVTDPFMNDRLVLIGGPQHPWKDRTNIEVSELNGASFILREQGSGTRELFESVMTTHGVKWSQSWVCTSAEAIKNAVAAGMGLSVISRMIVENEMQSGKLIIIEIKDVSFERKFNIVYHKNKFLSDGINNLIALCKKKYSD
jgi:DNA-binding transcriptional LysR family regulator